MDFFLKIPVGKDPGNLQVHLCSALLGPHRSMRGFTVIGANDLLALNDLSKQGRRRARAARVVLVRCSSGLVAWQKGSGGIRSQ